ncbi:HEPN domain-containing protein [Thermofilum sp.]|jgi:HEPN domain-containing protein|uniref:HEPN domain-containing protein n=1 Tax=Thermofilum sp. TaxID=1961369 RepID=UPI00258377B6|nr:HEPN domain-containing protein [Thermofilum sp.]
MSFELNPGEEVMYRLALAREHLERARKRLRVEDWAGVVEAAQLSAENAAKAVIAHFHVPSWSHDPSRELQELVTQLPTTLVGAALKLATIVRELAPEHGVATYGVPQERLTPDQLYTREKASNALKLAEDALEKATLILRELGYGL